MKKLFLLISSSISVFFNSYAQSVGIGTATPNNSAALDVSSTTKGVVLPRMTSAQRKAIASPATGLLVFDLDKSTIYMFDGVLWLPFLFSAEENSYDPKSIILPSDVEANDRFGYSVAVSGDYVIIGANGDKIGTNTGQGSAYIFMRSGGNWVMQSKLIASDGATNDFFGSGVGISGDYAVVGSPNDDVGSNTDQGSVYIFYRSGSTWTQQIKLTASDGAADDLFGSSVSMDGLQILVGAPEDDINHPNQGSAYFFQRTGGPANWSSIAKVVPSVQKENARFGGSVAISGTSAIIGAPNEYSVFVILPIADVGFAYIFTRSGFLWSEQVRIGNSGSDGNEKFGASVAISGTIAVVGAPNDDDGTATNFIGSVSIFEWNGTSWNLIKRFFSNDKNTGGLFGYSVAINGDYIVIGAPGCDIEGVRDKGAVYLYKRNGTDVSFIKKIKDDDGNIDSRMGSSVAMSSSYCFIGSMDHNQRTGKMLFLNYQ